MTDRVVSVPSGSSFSDSGTIFVDAISVAWSGSVSATISPAISPWSAYSGSMADEIAAVAGAALGPLGTAAFQNPALTALNAPSGYVGLGLWPDQTGTNYAGVATDTLTYSFAASLPAGTPMLLWDPGSGIQAPSGPSTFFVSASYQGQAVPTSAWSFQVENPFSSSPLGGYTVNPSTGEIIVDSYNGSGFPAAVVAITSTVPIDAIKVTATTSPYDFWGLALPAGVPPVTVTGSPTIACLRSQAVVTATGGTGTLSGPGISDALASVDQIRFIDGTLAYGAATIEAQAARLYQAAFGRAPDAAGLAYWVGVLQGGTSLDGIAAGFLVSAEFQARYGSLDDAGFVNALYRNVLGRAADAAGSAYWTATLASGTTRAEVLANFSESTENKSDTAPLLAKGLWAPDENAAAAARLYYATLDRAPDAAGSTYWTRQIESGTATLLQEANLFVTSSEFIGRYGALDNAGFVNLLYENVLGRAADPAGLAAWTGQLAQGGTRAAVVLGFSESAELKTRLAPVIETNGIVVG